MKLSQDERGQVWSSVFAAAWVNHTGTFNYGPVPDEMRAAAAKREADRAVKALSELEDE